ncbi:transglutaminase domain-containing protein [Paenibacillus sp. J22TS3]|uniref:transglutaminase domain-containing protein n=1 Tax=Paenibacillus sp. J22TS3 TaxID=2807192 RepID=UPI001B08857A|nr:transglutaminase domain-containing protein [Paenibacillus sp. J22TS3]GIP22778.1 hypothetical protein J22TS3_30530 [Paenibacillus sp. J22TS3]
MKRLLGGFLIAALLLSGCDDGSGQNAAKKAEAGTGAATRLASGAKVADLKKKYGAQPSDKAIMPLYNVDQKQVLEFKFNTKFKDQIAADVVSIHTDSKALKESEIFTLRDFKDKNAAKDTVEVKPTVGVLASDDNPAAYEKAWGNAPIYYARINYDLNADVPTKLDQPLIIPFTIKSEVPVPTVKYEISQDGRFRLKWNKVEGAEGYRIYNRSKTTLMKNENKPLRGAEEGYAGNIPQLVTTVTGTEFDDFMKDGRGGLGQSSDATISLQNMLVKGEYYVTAIAGGKESNFSVGVSTADLSERLPAGLAKSDNIFLKEYDQVSDIPRSVSVEFIDGSHSQRDLIFDTANLKIQEYGSTEVHFKVKGTALKGFVLVKKATPDDVKLLESNGPVQDTSGYVEPENTTDYVPSPDVPTIIDTTKGKEEPKKEEAPAPTDNLVDAQKDNTKKQVEEGNKQEVPVPEVTSEAGVNADSALEEYLALNMVDAKKEISLSAFPEAQNFETLSDVLQKVVYQNPLILGVKQYRYDYDTLTLEVNYDDTEEHIKKKQGEIIAEAKKIVAAVIKPGMSDDDKRKALYDYLNDNTKYDDEALKSAEASGFKQVDEKYSDSFNTYGIMVKKVGVCASYAATYKMLSDLSGLKAITVTGYMSGVPHAWNKVKIGQEWVNVDTTNNATNSGVPYLLYNSDDTTAKSIEYETDQAYWLDKELSEFKSTDNSKDYYVMNGLEVKSVTEYGTKLADQLKSGKPVIAIRMGAKLNEDEVFDEAAKVLSEVAKDKLKTAKLATLGTYIVLKP